MRMSEKVLRSKGIVKKYGKQEVLHNSRALRSRGRFMA